MRGALRRAVLTLGWHAHVRGPSEGGSEEFDNREAFCIPYHEAAGDRINHAIGAEWRDEQCVLVQGDRERWLVGPYAQQRFMSGANGFFGYGPQQAGTGSRYKVAGYGDVEVSAADASWTLGTAVRVEYFEDFGTTTNGKASGRFRFIRASVSSGFRAPTPGQQNGFKLSNRFDPIVNDLVNYAVFPSISPAARLRGRLPLGPERSVNYTAGVVLDTGPFTLTADYFRIDVSDRIGITSDFVLTRPEIASLVAREFEAAESVRAFGFFTNALATFGTYSQIAVLANQVGEQYSEYTPWGYSGAYYYVRIGYDRGG